MRQYRAPPTAEIGPVEASGRRQSEAAIAMEVDAVRGGFAVAVADLIKCVGLWASYNSGGHIGDCLDQRG